MLEGIPVPCLRALNLLLDDGMPLDKAAGQVVAAYQTGRDPEQIARKWLKLRAALRNSA